MSKKEKFKVAYCAQYGGFGLSREAVKRIKEIDDSYEKWDDYDFGYKIPRHDPALIQAIEELGLEVASGPHCTLEIEEISGRTYRINEYDGNESVETPENDHLSWTVIG